LTLKVPCFYTLAECMYFDFQKQLRPPGIGNPVMETATISFFVFSH
jgi:hypothetical protein